MSDFVVEFKVRNGRLRRAIREAGYPNINQFCAAFGLSQSEVGLFLNLKKSPIDREGHWRPTVLRMAEALNLVPEDLFTPMQRTLVVPSNAGEREVSETQMLALIGCDQSLEWELLGSGDPLALLERDDAERPVATAISRLNALAEFNCRLSPREAKVLTLMLDDGLSGREVAQHMNFSDARVHQILRKIKLKVMHIVAHATHAGEVPPDIQDLLDNIFRDAERRREWSDWFRENRMEQGA